jgi:hypothetical protein
MIAIGVVIGGHQLCQFIRRQLQYARSGNKRLSEKPVDEKIPMTTAEMHFVRA